jgi:DNA-binding CsgD family transcriptional regulator
MTDREQALSGAAVESALSAIYDCATRFSSLKALLSHLAEALGARTAALIHYNRLAVPLSSASIRRTLNAIEDGKDQSDVLGWGIAAAALTSLAGGSAHILGPLSLSFGPDSGCLVAGRCQAAGPFGEPEAAFVRTLIPHLERALQLQRFEASLQPGVNALASAAERLSRGVLVIERTGEASFVNREARRIFADQDGLRLVSGRLRAETGRDQRALNDLISMSTEGRARRRLAAAVSVARPSLRGFYLVRAHTAPLMERGAADSVVVSIRDPERSTAPDAHELRQTFRLTGAEVRLAVRLGHGEHLSNAAANEGISRETARSHLKALFRKTGTHRQPELVALLCAPVLGGLGLNKPAWTTRNEL